MPREFAHHQPTPAPQRARDKQPPAQPHDWLANAHGNHAHAQQLKQAYDHNLFPEDDAEIVARAERYYDMTPAADANWNDCLQAAIRDRQTGHA